MSDPTPTPVYPTRQQLDELEALMERMLALPVSQSEEEADQQESPALAAVLEPAANGHAPRTVSLPEPPPWFDNDPVAVDVLPPPDRLERVEALPQPVEPAAEPSRPVAAREMPRPPWPVRPLVWCNRAFDRWTFNLGRTGRWLRRPVGRNFIGVLGVLFSAGAAAWAILDWIGWTW